MVSPATPHTHTPPCAPFCGSGRVGVGSPPHCWGPVHHQGEEGMGMVGHVGAQGGKAFKDPRPLAQPSPSLAGPQANPTNSLGVLV